LFFTPQQGKVEFATTMDRDGCIAVDTKTRVDSMLALRNKLAQIARDRRKDDTMYGKHIMLAKQVSTKPDVVIR
jgi:hypothetical protein